MKTGIFQAPPQPPAPGQAHLRLGGLCRGGWAARGGIWVVTVALWLQLVVESGKSYLILCGFWMKGDQVINNF